MHIVGFFSRFLHLSSIFDSLEIPLKQDLSNFSKKREMKRSELRYRRVFIENARPSFPDPRKPSITLLGAREGETPPVPGRATERGRSARWREREGREKWVGERTKSRTKKEESVGGRREGEREVWLASGMEGGGKARPRDEFTFCRTLIRGQLYRAGVCLHTMNRAFSIDVAGRLTPICCAFCSLLGLFGPAAE